MLPAATKNWDDHVVHAEEVARGPGFQNLRDRILGIAQPSAGEVVVDVGAGTGLLALAVAPSVGSVWAVDLSPRMCEALAAKATSDGSLNVQALVASAVSLPLADCSADVVVSNYCFHHLGDADKRRALSEAFRVLRPGGRLVFADMMFGLGVVDLRDRRVLIQKVRALLGKGPAGVVRLIRNVVRILAGRWERPARLGWWEQTLEQVGFINIRVDALEHEGGIAQANRP
ncbi:MAG: class I SAM-dependent methyltransferase [Solirubrobacteraceae bacterium]